MLIWLTFSDSFTIESATGTVKTTQPLLNMARQEPYELKVMALDGELEETAKRATVPVSITGLLMAHITVDYNILINDQIYQK